MKKKRTLAITVFSLLAVIALGITVYAATSYGTQSDPLITLSYLTDKLTPEIMSKLDGKLNDAVKKIEGEIGSGNGVSVTYTLVTLSAGQTLSAAPGCEVLLRSGTASVVTGGSDVIDMTTGDSIMPGSYISENHICVFSASGAIIASTLTTLLVRGNYVIS